MTILVVGIFGHKTDASLAIQDLRDSGIKTKKISVVAKEKSVVSELSRNTGVAKPQEGLGSIGLFGTAKGIAIGLNMLPDTAVAAGPAARRLAGAEFGDDPGEDGIVVGLIGIGIPKEDAEAYEKHVDLGHVIVIAALEQAESGRVSKLFESHQAIPLN
ncbi:general stress protein [Paenibacillus sp. URB8-2]|uniref:general stress protein n=1 Tax=Paenibacillus sp. URB8-2 TaxID=2741301 RepID=UPI0015B96592|nr:general stress protein [Paenibacillus sp. URB8-2]BCG60147.1 hypothetical protein PUR_35720 [Paenibacillus sp. URB8-2]